MDTTESPLQESLNNIVKEEEVTVDVEFVHVPKRKGRPSKDALFTCALCDFKCEDIDFLQEHAKLHNDRLAFGCPICRRLFSQKGNLYAHIRTHTKDRPYKCEICSFSAAQKINLVVHYRKHTKEKPYRCQECDFGAAQLANIQSHYWRKHGFKYSNWMVKKKSETETET